MNSFAILVQPRLSSVSHNPGYQILTRTSAFLAGSLEGLVSLSGHEMQGWVICLPLIPAQDQATIPGDFNGRQASKVIALSRKLGVKILGVGESVFEELAPDAASKYGFPILSSGNVYRACIIRSLLRQVPKCRGIPLSQLKVVVVGAGGALGRLCAQVLAGELRNLVLVGISEKEFGLLSTQILYETGVSVRLGRELERELREADVVLLTDKSYQGWGEREWAQLKPGAWVIMGQYEPKDSIERFRPDIFLINKLMVTLSKRILFRSRFRFKVLRSLFYATWPEWINQLTFNKPEIPEICNLPVALAETMLLAQDHPLTVSGTESYMKIKCVNQLDQMSTRLGFIPQLIDV